MKPQTQAGSIDIPKGKELIRYKATPMQVVEADPKTGKPRLFRIMYPGESVNTQDGMEFWVVYVKQDLLEAQGKS